MACTYIRFRPAPRHKSPRAYILRVAAAQLPGPRITPRPLPSRRTAGQSVCVGKSGDGWTTQFRSIHAAISTSSVRPARSALHRYYRSGPRVETAPPALSAGLNQAPPHGGRDQPLAINCKIGRHHLYPVTPLPDRWQNSAASPDAEYIHTRLLAAFKCPCETAR